jgi:hypothetical protein
VGECGAPTRATDDLRGWCHVWFPRPDKEPWAPDAGAPPPTGRLPALVPAGDASRSKGARSSRRGAVVICAAAPRFSNRSEHSMGDMYYRFYDRYRVFNNRRQGRFPYRFHCECALLNFIFIIFFLLSFFLLYRIFVELTRRRTCRSPAPAHATTGAIVTLIHCPRMPDARLARWAPFLIGPIDNRTAPRTSQALVI